MGRTEGQERRPDHPLSATCGEATRTARRLAVLLKKRSYGTSIGNQQFNSCFLSLFSFENYSLSSSARTTQDSGDSLALRIHIRLRGASTLASGAWYEVTLNGSDGNSVHDFGKLVFPVRSHDRTFISLCPLHTNAP